MRPRRRPEPSTRSDGPRRALCRSARPTPSTISRPVRRLGPKTWPGRRHAGSRPARRGTTVSRRARRAAPRHGPSSQGASRQYAFVRVLSVDYPVPPAFAGRRIGARVSPATVRLLCEGARSPGTAAASPSRMSSSTRRTAGRSASPGRPPPGRGPKLPALGLARHDAWEVPACPAHADTQRRLRASRGADASATGAVAQGSERYRRGQHEEDTVGGSLHCLVRRQEAHVGGAGVP